MITPPDPTSFKPKAREDAIRKIDELRPESSSTSGLVSCSDMKKKPVICTESLKRHPCATHSGDFNGFLQFPCPYSDNHSYVCEQTVVEVAKDWLKNEQSIMQCPVCKKQHLVEVMKTLQNSVTTLNQQMKQLSHAHEAEDNKALTDFTGSIIASSRPKTLALV